MTPKPDRRFAGVTSLGQFRKLYRSDPIYRVIALVLAAFMLTPLAYRLISRQPFAEGGTGDLLLALIGAPLVFWLFDRRSGDAVALYEDGIACAGSDGMLQVRWNEINSVWKAPPSGSEYNMRMLPHCGVTTRSGRIVELTGLARLSELWAEIEKNGSRSEWAEIEKNEARSEWAEIVEQIHSGETMTFGPFEVGLSGLALVEKGKERFVEWAHVDLVKERASDWNLVVLVAGEQPGSRDEWACVSPHEIPRVHIFLRLCNEMSREHRPVPG